MPSIFEPAARFSRGVHKAIAVDAERLTAVLKALDVAFVVGEPAPLVSLIDAHVGVSLDPAAFWESDDGYAPCHRLHHYIPKILAADGASPFGLDVLGEIYDENLVLGAELLDRNKAVSPEWLTADPQLPFRYAAAEELLASIDFTAGIDEGGLSSASEAFDMGELGDDISGVGDFQVDALDDWAARLGHALTDFRINLEDIAARHGIVLNWYESA